MTPEQASDLAQRTLAAIDHSDPDDHPPDHREADRERVASDLAGLLDHHADHDDDRCPDVDRYADNLRRTAALYGEAP